MPDSPMAIAVKAARTLISNSATFIAAVGAANPTAALADIYFDEHPTADDPTKYPNAIVSLEPSSRLSAIMEGCPQTSLVFNGVVLVELLAHADETGDGAYINYLNFMGNVLADMNTAFNGPNDNFGFTDIDLITPPIRSPNNNRGNEDFFFTALTFKGHE